jgi:hypothetical protein
LIISACAALFASQLSAQTFPPGTFKIDGIPVFCSNTFTVYRNMNDVGMNDGQGHIYINPMVLASQPTVLKLFWYAHECGHTMVGSSETGADCWAIKTGKAQGWFPPEAFKTLEEAFANNPGDWTHLPGPARVAAIEKCYGYQKKDKSTDDETDSSTKPSKAKSPPISADDEAFCAKLFRVCTEGITEPDACVSRRQKSCIADCTENYHHSYAVCESQFCNPDHGSPSHWEEQCTKRADDQKAECAESRQQCRDEHTKRPND